MGPRGKSFRTMMLKEKGESIDTNSMCERHEKVMGKIEGKDEYGGVTACQYEPMCTNQVVSWSMPVFASANQEMKKICLRRTH